MASSLDFDTGSLRKLLDGESISELEYIWKMMIKSNLFCPRERGGKVFISPDFNQPMEQQRDMTMKRIDYLRDQGALDGWLTRKGPEAELIGFIRAEAVGYFDHSLVIKLFVQFFLWGGAISYMGTKRHHDKWLKPTETYEVKGCFAMSELGHGSNVRGIETTTIYDANTQEFVINTPCESAQKYWIGGAAKHATHTVVFSQLEISGVNQGVHAFIAQIRDQNGNICPNVRIADCGHKIGLNGVDNGRIWFDHLRIPRENMLNSVADVSPDGQYLSSIKDPLQRFAAFMAPLTFGRVIIPSSAVIATKIGLATAIRYSLSRRAFSIRPNEPEVLLLDYPSHQRRLLPLLAKTYVMNFASNYLKMLYVKRTPESIKAVHVVSSAIKAVSTWHCLRTLQECREACGGQGIKTENHVGQLKSEYDVQLTFEGDNNVLMQQTYQIAEDLGRAFSDRLILQTCLDVEARIPEGALKNALGLMRSMYTTTLMEEDASFLRYGYLSTNNAAAVREEVPKLCSELRPRALNLVTSFGIPDAFLGPIAFNWLGANAWSSL